MVGWFAQNLIFIILRLCANPKNQVKENMISPHCSVEGKLDVKHTSLKADRVGIASQLQLCQGIRVVSLPTLGLVSTTNSSLEPGLASNIH